jgi:transposase
MEPDAQPSPDLSFNTSAAYDVHKVNSQLCIVGENAEVLEERRIQTDRERFCSGAGEAAEGASSDRGVDGERVGCELPGGLCHEVIVADPNFAPMYATRSKR